MRLFIADDSQILLNRLSSILSEIEEVRIVGQAENSIEAVKAVKNLKPDVVILDIRLPGKHGIFALEEIKKIENPPIVIMFTNFPYLQYRKKCMNAGADFFFYKAVEFESLVNTIKKLIKANQHRKANKYSS